MLAACKWKNSYSVNCASEMGLNILRQLVKRIINDVKQDTNDVHFLSYIIYNSMYEKNAGRYEDDYG